MASYPTLHVSEGRKINTDPYDSEAGYETNNRHRNLQVDFTLDKESYGAEKWVFYATLASLLIIFFMVTSCVLALMEYNRSDASKKMRLKINPGLILNYDFVVFPLTNTSRNFSDAEVWCTNYSKGGHLAVIKNEEEEEQVNRKIRYSTQYEHRIFKHCPYFMLGHRAMSSRIWRSINGRSFLPALQIPYQYDFREESSDCFIFDFRSMASKTVACSTKMRCAACEVVTGCGDKYRGPENSCYTLEAFEPHRPSNIGDSQRIYPLRTFNQFQRVCRHQHGGRLAAFNRKFVPNHVADEMMREMDQYNLWEVCNWEIAARGMEVTHEYETTKEDHISYWSSSLTDPPSSNHCLASDGNKWIRIPCNQDSCFVCAARIYEDLDQEEIPPKDVQDAPSDLNPLVWG